MWLGLCEETAASGAEVAEGGGRREGKPAGQHGRGGADGRAAEERGRHLWLFAAADRGLPPRHLRHRRELAGGRVRRGKSPGSVTLDTKKKKMRYSRRR